MTMSGTASVRYSQFTEKIKLIKEHLTTTKNAQIATQTVCNCEQAFINERRDNNTLVTMPKSLLLTVFFFFFFHCCS
jgi:hypothetical protein